MLKIALDGIAATFATLAAYFWFQSAATPMPAPVAYCDFTPEHDPFLRAFRAATRLNRTAAACAGLSATTAAAASIVADFLGG